MTDRETILIGEDDDGCEIEVPARFEVCGRCEGRGSHVNPAIDGHGISPDEFAEDPDFREAYFAGRYDVPCHACGGKRVVLEPDEDRMTPEERAALEEWRRDLARAADERRSEERFGY